MLLNESDRALAAMFAGPDLPLLTTNRCCEKAVALGVLVCPDCEAASQAYSGANDDTMGFLLRSQLMADEAQRVAADLALNAAKTDPAVEAARLHEATWHEAQMRLCMRESI